MDSIRSWALGICVCSFSTALICFLMPKGQLEKPMRTVVSIFLLSVVISPLINLRSVQLEDFGISIEESEGEIGDRSQDIKDTALENYKTFLEETLTTLLKEQGQSGLDINVEAEFITDGSLNLKSIKIKPERQSAIDREKIIEIIQKETGITPIFL